MIRESTKDFVDVKINLGGDLCFCKDVCKFVIHKVSSVVDVCCSTVLLSLTDVVEALFDVTCLQS